MTSPCNPSRSLDIKGNYNSLTGFVRWEVEAANDNFKQDVWLVAPDGKACGVKVHNTNILEVFVTDIVPCLEAEGDAVEGSRSYATRLAVGQTPQDNACKIQGAPNEYSSIIMRCVNIVVQESQTLQTALSIRIHVLMDCNNCNDINVALPTTVTIEEEPYFEMDLMKIRAAKDDPAAHGRLAFRDVEYRADYKGEQELEQPSISVMSDGVLASPRPQVTLSTDNTTLTFPAWWLGYHNYMLTAVVETWVLGARRSFSLQVFRRPFQLFEPNVAEYTLGFSAAPPPGDFFERDLKAAMIQARAFGVRIRYQDLTVTRAVTGDVAPPSTPAPGATRRREGVSNQEAHVYTVRIVSGSAFPVDPARVNASLEIFGLPAAAILTPPGPPDTLFQPPPAPNAPGSSEFPSAPLPSPAPPAPSPPPPPPAALSRPSESSTATLHLEPRVVVGGLVGAVLLLTLVAVVVWQRRAGRQRAAALRALGFTERGFPIVAAKT